MRQLDAVAGWVIRAWARHSRVSVWAVRILGLALAIAGFAYADHVARIYAGSLRDNRAWVDTVKVQQASTLTGKVFDRLVKSELVTLVHDGNVLRIVAAPCENLIAPVTPDTKAPAVGGDKYSDLRLLCESTQGEEIRDEIELWNDSFRFVAIRDDRPGEGPGGAPAKPPPGTRGKQRPTQQVDVCDGGKLPLAPYIEPGCKRNRWTAELVGGTTASPAQTLLNGAPPPSEYALIAGKRADIDLDLGRGTALGGGDWLQVKPSPGLSAAQGETYRLHSHMLIGPRPIVIDLVGSPVSISADNQALGFPSEWGEVMGGSLGRVQLSAELVCDDRDFEATDDCSAAPQVPIAHSYAIALTAKSTIGVDVSIDVRPIDNLPRRIVVKEEQESVNPNDKVTIARTARLRAECRVQKGLPLGDNCALSWRTPPGAEPQGDKKYQIVARDGKTQLVDEFGVIKPAARELDLDPIVGLGPRDSGSLTAALAAGARGKEQTIKLTIDPWLQGLAFNQLIESSWVGKCRGRIAHWRDDDIAKCNTGEKRAAIVLIDADKNPGEILAMASWPPVNRNLNLWDLDALEQGYASHSPLAGAAWRATNVDDQPGSTFKVVTSLMAIEHALSNKEPSLRSLLLGETKLEAATTLLRLARERSDPKNTNCDVSRADPSSFDVLPVLNTNNKIMKCLHNAEGAGALGLNSFLSPRETQCVGGSERQVGLCEAIISSSNLYFGGLAQLIDGPAAITSGNGDRPPLEMVLEAKRLYPDKPGYDILHGMVRPANPPVPLLRVPRLMADPLVIDAGLPDQDASNRRLSIAEAGFGQSVTATALTMATIYGSVGGSMASPSTGIIRPHLLPADSAEYKTAHAHADPETDPTPGRPLLGAGTPEEQKPFLDQLRQGFAGVVRYRTGTAHAIFTKLPLPRLISQSDAHERLFVKTGTATIEKGANAQKTIYSSWLAGWVEPAPGSGITSRIAFACWVTRGNFGAATCGPIMQPILDALDRRASQ